MAQPPLSQFFTDILSEEKIDEFHHRKDLDKLVELCLIYNNGPDRIDFDRINIDEVKDEKLKMVVALWARGVTIPEYLNLTYGEPYDSRFKRCAMEDAEYLNQRAIEAGIERFVSPSKIDTYKILKYPQQLAGFLAAMVEPYHFSKNPKTLNELGLTYTSDKNFLVSLLTLKHITLAYLTLTAKNYIDNWFWTSYPNEDIERYLDMVSSKDEE
jgi:hypothetical protein